MSNDRPPTPPLIPDHTLLRCIGRGAYGEVWLARNVMGAPRAVKLIWRRQFDSDRPYDREFEGIQRYEPVSRSADGLVHVLHVGRNDAEGYFYYVMELADSATATATKAASPDTGANTEYSPRTLRSDLKHLGRLPIAECLRVGLDVASGLATLHEHELVHRDVKPGNIIFVDGRAKLADIGLVSPGSEGRTFVGTEGYIPPEGPGAPAADLYALGMSLYEAATGYAPEEFPKVPPAWFREEAGTDTLEFHEVVLKACEGAKARRYQSAEQMRADLALLQSGQSVRHVRMLEKRAALTQRLAWAGGLVVFVAVGTALFANWRARLAERTQQRESALLHEAQDARGKESEARTRAESAERDARQQLNVALFEQARALVLSKELGHRTHALDALRRAANATNAAELRRVAFAAMSLPDLRLEREIKLDTTLTMLQPDPEFARAALCTGQGPVTICSLPNLEVLATLPASTNLDAYGALWSRDGRFLAVKRQHDSPGIRADWEVWNVSRAKQVLRLGPDIAHGSVTFHPRQPRFLAAHGGGRVTEWDLENGQLVRSFNFANTGHALSYSADGQQLAACYRAGTAWVVAFHDAATMAVLRTVECPESMELLNWHPKGRWVTGSGVNASPWGRGVRLIETDSGTITTLGEHKIKTTWSEFTADGQYLVSGGWDREIICWDLATLQRTFTYAGPSYRHLWSRDGKLCAVVRPNGVLELYALERPSSRALTGNVGDALQDGVFSADGRWLVARDGRQLCLWDVQSGAPAAVVTVPAKVVPFFSPDSRELFASAEGFALRGYLGRWRIVPGPTSNAPPLLEPLPMKSPNDLIRAAPTAHDLLMTSPEGVRSISWTNLDTGESRHVSIPGGLGCVSPNAQWLAMLYDFSPVVGIYRLPAMQEVTRIQTSNLVGFVTFSPTGDEMVVLNRSGAEWYDTTTWRRTHRLAGTPVSGSYAFYTPDGKGLWMVTHFRNAALLDRRTLEPLLPLPNDVLPLALSPDGRQLAVSIEGRRVQLWDLQAFRAELAKLRLDW